MRAKIYKLPSGEYPSSCPRCGCALQDARKDKDLEQMRAEGRCFISTDGNRRNSAFFECKEINYGR